MISGRIGMTDARPWLFDWSTPLEAEFMSKLLSVESPDES